MCLLFSNLQCFRNGTAADNHIPLVQDYSLSRCYSPLRGVEFHPGETVFLRINGSGLLNLAVAGLGGYFQRLHKGREGVPVPVCCPQCCGKQRLMGSEGDGVGLHILLHT